MTIRDVASMPGNDDDDIVCVGFSDLVGRTITEVLIHRDDRGDILEIGFVCSDGMICVMLHMQDCCESVRLIDIAGDLPDLTSGWEVVEAEESTNRVDDHCCTHEPESYTWTFYKLGTMDGRVTFRWFGTSNGHYSERCSIEWRRISSSDDEV